MSNKGHKRDTHSLSNYGGGAHIDDFVLEKGIFSNIFEKDIKRVYIYKKAERLAKAIHLVAPAFRNSPALQSRLDTIAVALVDAAILPPSRAKEALSRELLALSSVLSIARAGALLSIMNADLIAREAHTLLHELATYEEPRLYFEEAPTLAALFKTLGNSEGQLGMPVVKQRAPQAAGSTNLIKDNKGHILDTPVKTGRRDAIISVLEAKGPSYIKDISTVIRDVSEKTIQRELSALVAEGRITRAGERRWTTYTLSL